MYRCIIIDDEIHAIKKLGQFLQHLPEMELLAFFTSPIEALRWLNSTERIDLILLDVDMPEMSGIELSCMVRGKTDKLVFTTAHIQYGYEAFKVDASGYLLKPYSLSTFLSLMSKLFPTKNELTEKTNPALEEENFFFVKSKEDNLKLVRIDYNDILAVESKLNYIRIHTHKKSIFTYMSLSEMSKKLIGRAHFAQFQRSFIICTKHIQQIDGNTIEMDNGLKISVGDYYRKDFNDFIGRLLLKSKRRA